MWDFSWLERRWPGGGFEDWDRALSELKVRGYDQFRIDAYPHLIAHESRGTYELIPCWNTQCWGSPERIRVTPGPSLLDFIRTCKNHQVKVALSSWFREDRDNLRMRILNAEDHAAIWIHTLEQIGSAGLLDTLSFVDLANEWPHELWCPFFDNLNAHHNDWRTPQSLAWMEKAVDTVRTRFPKLPLTFSFNTHILDAPHPDVSFLDLLELHIWMANHSDFYSRVGYEFERFSGSGYENLVRYGEALYRANPAHWQGKLTGAIDAAAQWSRQSGLPLVTTECWGPIDYKDGPMLDWGWVKELCEIGSLHSAQSGRWVAIGTSNFCAPQFHGMWDDPDWHIQLTAQVGSSSCDLF